ncbi:MAG: hypothetical protein FJ303_21495 [Planctomycetes bacterium]|nr:hypothetical protein [Planctomycetota bacterium]
MTQNNPHHQKETEWQGDVYRFEGPALAPDDPRAYRGVRRGRPGEPRRTRPPKKRGAKKAKK